MAEFKAFPKIPRLNREVIITEKIDGTNACIVIGEDGQVSAQSRNRVITPASDNYGFAKWVEVNQEELRKLGHGYHYGEWWGKGINRGYGLSERRFSLFNATRWGHAQARPACCDVVPVLAYGVGIEDQVRAAMLLLRTGSFAAPGFMDPEGVVVFHTASNHIYKVTCEGDDVPKSAALKEAA